MLRKDFYFQPDVGHRGNLNESDAVINAYNFQFSHITERLQNWNTAIGKNKKSRDAISS